MTALDRDRSGAALERQVLETVAQVESAYWALVAARRDRNVRRDSLALAEQQRADTLVRIEARTVALSDLAEPTAEVERRRGDVFAAQEAVARAERNRPEIAELTAQIARREIDVVVARDGLKPKLDLVAGYAMRGLVQAARAGLTAAETQLHAEQVRFGVGLSTNFFALARGETCL